MNLSPSRNACSLIFAAVLLGGIPTYGQTPSSRAASAPLPTAKQVFDKSLQATGGMAGWLRLVSLRLRADISDDNTPNFKGKLEINSMAPNKITECVTLSIGVFVCRGYDGKSGWGDDSKNGLTALDAAQLHEIQSEADFHSELHRQAAFASVVVKGEDVFNNIPVYVLEGTLKDGHKQELFFAKDTGFEAGAKDFADSAVAAKTTYLEDYKEIAGVGVKIATKTRVVTDKSAIRMAAYEIVPNPLLAASVFAKPEKSARDTKGSGIDTRPDNGKVVDGVYANQFFGFRYAVPQGWTVHGEETQKVLSETGRDLVAGDDENKRRIMEAAAKRSFHLLTVFEYPLGTPNKPNRGLQVLAENIAFAPGIQTGKDYLLIMAKNLASSQLHATFDGDPVQETIDGIDFYRQALTMEVSGKVVHELFYSTVEKGFAVSFLFTAQTGDGTLDAAKSMATIHRLPTTTTSLQP